MAKDQTSYLPPVSTNPLGFSEAPIRQAPVRVPTPTPTRLPQRIPHRVDSTPLRLGHIRSQFTGPQRTLGQVEERTPHPPSCFRSVTAEARRAEDIQFTRQALGNVDQIYMQGPYNGELVMTHLAGAHASLERVVRADGCELHPATQRLMDQYFSQLAIVREDSQLQLDPGLLSQLSQFTVDRTDGGMRIYQPGTNGISHADVEPTTVIEIE